jgi:hypothetical protein
LCYTHTKAKWCEHTNKLPGSSLKISSLTLDAHKQHTHHLAVRHGYVTFDRNGSTSTKSCTASTHLRGASALPQLCHAPRLLFSWLHWLYINYAMCRDYSLPTASTLHQQRHAFGCLGSSRGPSSGLHRLYCAYAMHPNAPSLPLNFSSVGRTGSQRASGHCVSRRDYSSSGLHRLYCAYAVHPDAPSRRSTSRRSIALALAVRPVTASRGTTTRHPNCTCSTVPMPCIRTRCLDARLLVNRSHWLSPCARSFCGVS